MYRHQVATRFRSDIGEDVRVGSFAFVSQSGKEIEGAVSFVAKVNTCPEEKFAHGLEDIFWFDFANLEDLEEYRLNRDRHGVWSGLIELADGHEKGVQLLEFEV